MSKVIVELESEQIDAIVKKELNDVLKGLKKDIKGTRYCHPDDIEMAREGVKAVGWVLRYYGG